MFGSKKRREEKIRKIDETLQAAKDTMDGERSLYVRAKKYVALCEMKKERRLCKALKYAKKALQAAKDESDAVRTYNEAKEILRIKTEDEKRKVKRLSDGFHSDLSRGNVKSASKCAIALYRMAYSTETPTGVNVTVADGGKLLITNDTPNQVMVEKFSCRADHVSVKVPFVMASPMNPGAHIEVPIEYESDSDFTVYAAVKYTTKKGTEVRNYSLPMPASIAESSANPSS